MWEIFKFKETPYSLRYGKPLTQPHFFSYVLILLLLFFVVNKSLFILQHVTNLAQKFTDQFAVLTE